LKKPVQKIANVAVVAANYNNGRFLRAFIHSILASTMLPEQIIIIDDGSTDHSRKILKELKNIPRATFIFSEKNEGFANALNKGIAAVKTTYIMRADPDDLLHPSKIEKQFEFLQAHPEICGIGSNVEYFHVETARKLNRSNFPIGTEAVKKAYLKGEHGLQHPTVMMKAEVLKEFPYNQHMVPAEDYDLFTRLIAWGYQFTNLSEVLYTMRIHKSSISSNLKFATIKKTFKLREELLGIRTFKLKQWFYFFHIVNYRRYLLEQNKFKKAVFLLLSIVCYPQKVVKRIKLWMN
jgi:glycosyltransferase involved in cell wall biosynthesis